MTQFFGSNGVEPDAVTRIREAAEQLLLNAFYEAPVAAGAEKKRIEHTRDVALPDEHACDIAYACSSDLAMLRIADPFGALRRERVIDVLQRRATNQPPRKDAATAESGLWRVFSTAAVVAVSVVKNHRTELLYAIPKRGTPEVKPYAFHYFYKEGPRRGIWKLVDEDTGSPITSASMSLIIE
jgi:hypothetical protein